MHRKFFGVELVWIIVVGVVFFYLNYKYPLTTSPFWFWNRKKYNDPVADQMGSGTGNSTWDESFE